MIHSEGSLYCLHNSAFSKYGRHYYKLGRTKDLRKRLYTYQTSYIEPSVYVAVSERRFRSSEDAECLLFYLLRRFRVKSNREFFHVPLSMVRHMLIRVASISDDRIAKIVSLLKRKKLIYRYSSNDDVDDLIERFETECKLNTDITRDATWEDEQEEFLEDFFERFRFKPKQEDVEKYKKYGYKPVEDVEMDFLLNDTTDLG